MGTLVVPNSAALAIHMESFRAARNLTYNGKNNVTESDRRETTTHGNVEVD